LNNTIAISSLFFCFNMVMIVTFIWTSSKNFTLIKNLEEVVQHKNEKYRFPGYIKDRGLESLLGESKHKEISIADRGSIEII
jgi:hypothetical protein